MTAPDLPAVPESRRRNARIILAVAALLLLGYPAVFFGWYLTAEHVTARITSCPADTPNALRCPTSGEWRLADGSTGTGRIYIQTPDPTDVGRTLPARAGPGFAVADGVTASAPGTYATIAAGFDALLLLAVLAFRRVFSPPPPRGQA